jgi:D-tyrosyl-tRNA(Tyr) deacylase
MQALIQRVSEARVVVEGETIGAIGPGLLVLVCAEPADTETAADKLLAKLLKLRIFSDDAGKMNRSVQDLDGQGTPGGLLLVSQFTLAADLSCGNRPSFTKGRCPRTGEATVRPLGDKGPRQPSAGGHGPLRHRHEGAPCQRRARDHSHAGGLKAMHFSVAFFHSPDQATGA